MGIERIKSRHVVLERVLNQKHASLMESVHGSITEARDQVVRSGQIVAQSREIIDRTRSALARAAHIQLGMAGEPPHNPIIEPKNE